MQGASLPSDTLDLFPIQNGIAPEPRRLSLLLTLMTYGLLFLGIRFAWMHQEVAGQKHPSASLVTHLVYLDDEPPVLVPQDQGSSNSDVGTGTIDPSLLESALAKPRETPTLNLDILPTSIPQENMLASPNPALPVALGGDGLSKGHGTGSGHGNGTGISHGNGALSGAKGDGPTLSIADMNILHQENPKYPDTARSALVQGLVVLRVTIDEKGVPVEMDVVSGHALLVPETLRAMKLWRFGSVKHQGRAVSAVFTVSILYLLNGA